MSDYNRFRERKPSEALSFYGNAKGKKPTPGSQLGVIQKYNMAGTLVESTPVNATGSVKDSYTTERTWDEVHPGPPFRTGGNFANVKIRLPAAQIFGTGSYSAKGNPSLTGTGYSNIVYQGGFAPSQYTLDGETYEDLISIGLRTPWAQYRFPGLTAYENKAWDLIRPKAEKAGFSQFSYELRDLPGMLRTSAKFFRDSFLLKPREWGAKGLGWPNEYKVFMPRSVADNWLNHHFGWAPFVNDLLKFYNTWEKSDKHIQDSIRNNGAWIRRKRLVDEQNVIKEIEKVYTYDASPVLWGLYPSLFSPRLVDGFMCFGRAYTALHEETQVWAEGKFTMYRPEFDPNLLGFDSNWSNVRRLLTLYGARINPAVLYRITPWSWLIDWFTGLGRNIEIATAALEDSVVAKYAYLMHHRKRFLRRTHEVFFYQGDRTFVEEYSLETKQRKAMLSPYGFNLSWDHLSPKQWSILGAIGIGRTRLP